MAKLNQVDLGSYLFERSAEALLLYDPTSCRILEVNTACEQLLERSQWELKGDDLCNVIHKTDSESDLEGLMRRMELHADRNGYYIETVDGLPISVELSSCPIPMDSQIVGLLTLQRVPNSDEEFDSGSGESKQTSDEHVLEGDSDERLSVFGSSIIRRQEMPASVSSLTSFKYRELVELFHELVWVTDIKGRIEYVNDAARRIYGYQPDEMIGRCFSDFQTPEQAGVDYSRMEELIRTGVVETFETQQIRKDGQPVELRMTAFTSKSYGGEVVGMSGTATDISARKRAEERLKERERWFRAIFDTDPDCVMLLDSNGIILDINAAGVRLLAASSVFELRGESIYDQVAPEFHDEYRSSLKSVFLGEDQKFEFELIGADGSRHWLQTNQVPLWTANRKISALLCVSQDVTQRRLADELQRGQNRVLESVALSKPLEDTLLQLAVTIEGQIDGVKCSVLILDSETGQLRHGAAPSLPDEYNNIVDGIQIGPGVVSCGTAAAENRCVIVDDIETHEYWAPFREMAKPFGIRACWSIPINDGDGNVLGTFAMYYSEVRLPTTDELELIERSANLAGIAIERSRAERVHKQSEERFRNVFNESPDAIFVEDLAGNVIDVNPAACKLHKMTRPELIAANVEDLVPDFLHDQVSEDFKKLASGEVDVIESFSLNSDNLAVPVEIRTTRINHDGQPALLLHVRDVTERMEAQDQLREAEERFRNLFEHSPDAIMVESEEGDILDVNRAACELHQMDRETLLQCAVFELVPERLRSRVLEDFPKMASGKLRQFERFSLRSDGVEVPVSIRINKIQYRGQSCIVAQARDITERVKAEEASAKHQAELAHFSRLRIMGELVAGIAHEVSQPLYAISNFASACRTVISNNEIDEAQILEWTEKIGIQAKRAGDIIHKMREFSKNKGPNRSTQLLKAMIDESIEFVSVEAREGRIDVRTEIHDADVVVLIDMVQMQQVLINLLRNAFQAMSEHEIPNRTVVIYAEPQGGMIQVTVADNGPGLPKNSDGSVFDAFVTTKSEGMGLGLAVSRSIVESHGGHLWVDRDGEQPSNEAASGASKEGTVAAAQGAKFHFTIPVHELEAINY